MEEALVARLRASSIIANVAGAHNGHPAVWWIERESDDPSAFPAVVMSIVSPGRHYDQDGASGLQQRRVRFECMGLSYEAAKKMSRAVTKEIEVSAEVGGVRFGRAMLKFERDMDLEDLDGGMKVFRTILDFILPATPQ